MNGYTRKDALASVGKGWAILINKLYDAKPRAVNVWQVKEKFGTLRFYVDSCPDWYDDLIILYEETSATICEKCGKEGKLREDRSWILTLCDDCNKEK